MLQTLRDVFKYIRHYPRDFTIGFVALIISSACMVQAPRFVGGAINALNNGSLTLLKLWGYLFGIVGIMTFSAFAIIIVRRTILRASWEIQFDIRHDLYKRFASLDQDYYDNNRTGDLMARLTSDINAVRMLVGVAMFMGTNTVLMIGFSLVRMFNLNVTLSVLTILVIPTITLSFFAIMRVVHRRYEKVQEQLSNVSAMAQENFSGVRVVKGFGIEEREKQIFTDLNSEYIKRNLTLTVAEAPMFPLAEVMFGVTLSLLLLLGGRSIINANGSLSVGEFVDFLLLFQGIQWPIIGMGWIATVFQRGDTSWRRLKEILAEEPRILDDAQTDHSLAEVHGDIRFENVHLELDGIKVLDDISFHLHAGETLGITGRTGAGKTMIINLISRIHDASEGTVKIDGRDIKHYPLQTLRGSIGIVPQEPFLFSDSIAENIAYGVESDDDAAMTARVKAVASLVQLADDVEDFPNQYQTKLGERGVTLSGGQRQRTAMARAIIRDPNILILDDSLSAVDTQTEANILKNLKDVAKDRSTIIVAHRLSAFQHADRILVLDEGKITEEGTHQALLAQDNWYAEMYRKQQLEAELEKA